MDARFHIERFIRLAALQQARRGHRVAIVSESGDIVTWLKPNGPQLTVERVVPVGIMPADIDGPHNVAIAPDMKSYFVTIAHGVPHPMAAPFSLARFETGALIDEHGAAAVAH